GPRSLQKSKQLDPSISLAPEISIPVKYVPVKGLSKFDGAKLCPEYRSRISELRHRKSTFSGRDCPVMLHTMLQQKAKSRLVFGNWLFGALPRPFVSEAAPRDDVLVQRCPPSPRIAANLRHD